MKYVCLECGNAIDIEYKAPQPEVIYDTHSSTNGFTATTDNSINIVCDKCGVKTIKFDDRMQEQIRCLIKEGVKIKDACSGLASFQTLVPIAGRPLNVVVIRDPFVVISCSETNDENIKAIRGAIKHLKHYTEVKVSDDGFYITIGTASNKYRRYNPINDCNLLNDFTKYLYCFIYYYLMGKKHITSEGSIIGNAINAISKIDTASYKEHAGETKAYSSSKKEPASSDDSVSSATKKPETVDKCEPDEVDDLDRTSMYPSCMKKIVFIPNTKPIAKKPTAVVVRVRRRRL